MYRYFFIAKNNIRKQKSDMITFFILTLIASALIFISASFLVGTGRVVDTCKEKINGADILIMMTDDEAAGNKMAEIIKGDPFCKGYESTRFLDTYAKYRHKGEKEWTDYAFDISSYEEERKMQRSSIRTGRFHGDQVVIPVSMSTSFGIGDVMELKIGDNIYRMKVAGYNEDNIYCSPMNMGTYPLFVSEKLYSRIEFENPGKAQRCRYYKTDLSKKAVSDGQTESEVCDDLFNEFNDWYLAYVKAHPDHSLASMNFIPSDLMRTASLILPMIFIAIVLAFALIMLVIALVIIHFSIRNFIMLNMKNTAIMEASGYTVKEMVLILLVELMLVAGLGCVFGLILGALMLKPAGPSYSRPWGFPGIRASTP